MITRALLLISAFAMACCTPPAVATRCNYADFEVSPYDHLIEDLPPATKAELVGRLKLRPGDVIDGAWPSGMDARLEVHGPHGFTEFLEVAGDGTFVRRGLSPGTYCFKVSASGFRSMIGTVVIDRTIGEGSPMNIELMIAE
jgi:hypothetical protein